MFLSELPKIVIGKKKRLGRGRGSGKGAKSGRGTTRHQKAREDIPIHFEGGARRIVEKFPLLRGKGKNKSVKQPTVAIQATVLNTFADGTKVTRELLLEKKLIRSNQSRIKIVGKADIQKKLIITLPVTGSVKQAVEAAGGKVENA